MIEPSSLIAYFISPNLMKCSTLGGSSPSKSGVRFDDSPIVIHYKPSGKDFIASFRFGGNTFQDEFLILYLYLLLSAPLPHTCLSVSEY